MNKQGLKKLDIFLLWCSDISQDEREEIMEFAGSLCD